MSGHSKWHNIQVRKGKQDAKKSNIFTKYAKLLTVAAQKGGDPAMNFSLRLAVEKAKASGMPKDNIERAIKRGTGEIAGERMEEIMYEGFGPSGIAVLIKTLTDNKNRTVSDLKHLLTAAGGSLGGAGSVGWMFGQWGVIVLPADQKNLDELELNLIDAGVEDITEDPDEGILIKTKLENFQKVLHKLKALGIEPLESGIRWIAKEKVSAGGELEGKLAQLFSDLEAHDDVEDYFTNAQ